MSRALVCSVIFCAAAWSPSIMPPTFSFFMNGLFAVLLAILCFVDYFVYDCYSLVCKSL